MEKKILIAMDGSANSKKAIEYTVQMESVIEDMRYILINIQPKLSEFLVEDARKDPKAKAALQDVVNKNRENSIKILDESKSMMIKLGIDEKHIELVSQPMIMGTAKGILDYAKQSLCDAIVMGRRGLSRMAESFMGSVSNSVLEHTNITPVWAIGGDVSSSKMMIAIDGSESALRAVDHASFMIGGNPDVTITLLHVSPRLRDYCTIEFDEEDGMIDEVITQGDKRCVDSFYIHAQQRFREAGIKESQVEIKQAVSTLNIGKTIVEEAKKGGFGTLVIGRRGIDNSFFMGSVSRHVLYNATDRAVWLVP
ncbi:MAG: universal stress protein [Deltaproteobacteria bacterium]|nr:universal stress protein [Deltaproteobacteria bacterium]